MAAEDGTAGLEECAQRPPLTAAAPSVELLRRLPDAVPGFPRPGEGDSEGSQRPSKDTSACSAFFSTLCRITVVVHADGGVSMRRSCVSLAISGGEQAGAPAAEGLASLF